MNSSSNTTGGTLAVIEVMRQLSQTELARRQLLHDLHRAAPKQHSHRLCKESMGVGLPDNDRGQYVYVKFIGTHAEYDKIDAAVVDQFKGV
jgi:hypothetical protein